MRENPKVVIDTNIFISALLGSKTCKHLYEGLKKGHFQLVLSPDLLMELEEVVKRAKFELDGREVESFIGFIKRRSIKVIPSERITLCRDPKDNLVLESVIVIKVDFIVTGDRDLLILSPFREIPIITPAKFLELLGFSEHNA